MESLLELLPPQLDLMLDTHVDLFHFSIADMQYASALRQISIKNITSFKYSTNPVFYM